MSLSQRRLLRYFGAKAAGGQGSVGLSNATYNSESRTQKIFVASGADFRLQIVPGAAHSLDEIDAKIQATEGMSLAEKAARFSEWRGRPGLEGGSVTPLGI